MCEFCDNKKNLDLVNTNILMTINFCPMCGRDLNPNVIKKGDKFTFKHPNYPNSSKVMIAEEVTSTHIEPKSNDLVLRKFPIQYCTKYFE
jgi:hypothetical protein